jgi:predicted negative regulator of RcsB-dependent stress response
VDDYLSEREQWEALKAWLRENGVWIIAGVAVGGLLLLGWRSWQARADRLGLEAGAKYEQVLEAFNRGDRTRAQSLVDELGRDYSASPYFDQATLAAARVAVQTGELDKAAASLKSVMDKSKDKQLALVARLRLARVQLAQGKPDDALTTLNGGETGAFEPRFHEVRGDVFYAKGDKAGALNEYRAARTGALTQSVDPQVIDLKIDDLVADAGVPAAAAAGQAK